MKINIDQERIFGLDILRMLAIVFVMLVHGAKFVPQKFAKYYSVLLFDGVGIFFVLSGYLIGGIFIRQMNKGVSLKEIKEFWIKRWTRTLPNYYFFLLLSILLGLLFSSVPNGVWEYFLFAQNIVTSPESFFSHSWSLSVEEWFYILFPVIVYLFVKLKIPFRKAVLAYIVLAITIPTIGRFYKYISIDGFVYDDFSQMRYSVFYRLDAIMYGVLGAYIHHYFPKFWNNNKKGTLVLCFILFVINFIITKFITSNFSYRIAELSITSIITLLSIPYLSTYNTIQYNTIQLRAVIVTISLISYSLYLINPMVGDGLTYVFNYYFGGVENPPIPWIVIFATFYLAFWGISIVLSYLVYRYFEINVTRYLRKKLIK